MKLQLEGSFGFLRTNSVFLQPYNKLLQTSLRQFISNKIAALFTEHTGFTTITEINEKLNQINSLERSLRIKKENLNQAEIQYKKGIDKMENRFHFFPVRWRNIDPIYKIKSII